MNRRNLTRTVLILAAVAMVIFAGPAQADPLEGELGILTPGTLAGNNPATGAPWASGDSYRFAFFTSERTTAESADISTYNMFVQNLANASTVYDIGADEGVTWKAIGSTSNVDAIDNTSTTWTDESPGDPIFLLDGSTLIASDYKDLWDGEIQNIIDLTEQGVVSTHWPWTGTYWDGTAAPGHGASFGALGNGGQVQQGNSAVVTDWIWRQWTGDPPSDELNIYALSDPLVVVVDDPNLPTVDAGDDMITWSDEPVTLAPTVVNNDPGVPQAALTYAWSADTPPAGVTVKFDPIAANDPTPKVTITKPADGVPATVTLTLAVNNVGSEKDDVEDTMTIDVYDDACKAAKGIGTVKYDSTDLNQDCITDFEDFALMATAWLYDYTITEAQPLP
jgi:hypothetical protein